MRRPEDETFQANADYLEAQEARFHEDPTSLSPEWRRFFEGVAFATGKGLDRAALRCEGAVMDLVNAYRSHGHLVARTNPVRPRRKHDVALDPSDFGLTEDALDRLYTTGEEVQLGPATLRAILAHLKAVYCGPVGIEYTHLPDTSIRRWLERRLEGPDGLGSPDPSQRAHLLAKLVQAVAFERFLDLKYVGQKRFSLQGAESFIPAFDALLRTAANLGVAEVVVGMAHRGRLNFLCNILGKPFEDVFSEFEGYGAGEVFDDEEGDVKYHKGHSADITFVPGRNLHLTLLANPSHLEAINPVILGKSRAKCYQEYGGATAKLLPVLVHGDAAIAGQGVNYELANLSRVRGYTTGGTIHLVLNNQIGFTTNYEETRSSLYCTDLAKMIQAPVFHVNGDDPEAVCSVFSLAVELRQRFHTEVFIDLLSYRRHGHNEGDEPRFTQPLLYQRIDAHPDVLELYRQRLLQRGDHSEETLRALLEEYRSTLQTRLEFTRAEKSRPSPDWLTGVWSHLRRATAVDFEQSPVTGVPAERLQRAARALVELPGGFNAHPKLVRLLEQRRTMLFDQQQVDWGLAEQLAYGTLLLDGHGVRLSGQDSRRGTFAHRHAVFFDQSNEKEYLPLQSLAAGKRGFHIYNSILSEYAVLGFEYGYAYASPEELVLWEAQFGDFSNGAQVILDQFLASAEVKWRRQCGLVLLLPHGYEGQGPEHSSARPERFLQVACCANLVLAQPTTPSNLFHLLRRQLAWPFRKPLVVFTGKSLLRHPEVRSPLAELEQGRFRELLLDEEARLGKASVVVLCSGKIYFDLLRERHRSGREELALCRLEQLHPLPFSQLEALRRRCPRATTWLWVQDEPANMGAWNYLQRALPDWPLQKISRPERASPATGLPGRHEQEQRAILDQTINYGIDGSQRGTT